MWPESVRLGGFRMEVFFFCSIFFFGLAGTGSRFEWLSFFLYKAGSRLVNCILCGDRLYCILWIRLNGAEMPLLIEFVTIHCSCKAILVFVIVCLNVHVRLFCLHTHKCTPVSGLISCSGE